jgi:5-methylcytosine-specific restriction endonuclease McrA
VARIKQKAKARTGQKRPTRAELEVRYSRRRPTWLREHIASVVSTMERLQTARSLAEHAQQAYGAAWERWEKTKADGLARIEGELRAVHQQHYEQRRVLDDKRPWVARALMSDPGTLFEPVQAAAAKRLSLERETRVRELDAKKAEIVNTPPPSFRDYIEDLLRRGVPEGLVPRVPRWYSERNKWEMWPEFLAAIDADLEYAVRQRDVAQLALGRSEKREQDEAAAAAHYGKTRQRAAAIKRGIRKQIRLYPNCPYCGCNWSTDEPEVHADHIYPVSKGGLSATWNMVYVCGDCNARKGAMTVREFASNRRLDWPTLERRLVSLGKRF